MPEVLPLDARMVEVAAEVIVQPGEDVRDVFGDPARIGNHRVIGIAFPKFRDGRGYSSARILRERGFDGDLRAVGDVTIDQLIFLKRCGFSSVEPDVAISRAAATAALARFPFVYQRAADSGAPAWSLRNG